ncbi:MAG TPA: hypothetical protein V6D19_01110 [Stenomitos sp.]
MLNQRLDHRVPHSTSWFQPFRNALERWVRREIIADDPYDEEQEAAQKLYEQFLLLQNSTLSMIVRDQYCSAK